VEGASEVGLSHHHAGTGRKRMSDSLERQQDRHTNKVDWDLRKPAPWQNLNWKKISQMKAA